jgi:hypothetical protein
MYLSGVVFVIKKELEGKPGLAANTAGPPLSSC